MGKSETRAHCEPDKKAKMGLDWPYHKETGGKYHKTSPQLESPRKKEERSAKTNMETFINGGPEDNPYDLGNSQDNSLGQRKVEDDYRGPMFHKEFRGLN